MIQLSRPNGGDGIPDEHAVSSLMRIYGSSAESWVLDWDFPSHGGAIVALRWHPGGPNSVLVNGSSPEYISNVIALLESSKIRAELLVADSALSNVQVLVDAGWVCIGGRPFMRRWRRSQQSGRSVINAVRELVSVDDLVKAKQVVADAFGSAPDVPMTPTDHRRVWGVYLDGDVVSCATTVEIDDTVAVWDVATRPKHQRRGYSTAILDAIHERFAATPTVQQFILLSSAEGFRLYESRGYQVLDWWQAWSRPRWVLGAR
jgi:GNAT superfamily N-acetyltransferase